MAQSPPRPQIVNQDSLPPGRALIAFEEPHHIRVYFCFSSGISARAIVRNP